MSQTQSIDPIMKTVSEQVFNRVSDAGAEGDLIIVAAESLSLQANQGELEEQSISNTQSFGVRVIKDDHVGIAYSEANDEASLAWMVDQAIKNANYSDPEPHEKIIDSQLQLVSDDQMFCPEDPATIEQQIEMLMQLEQGLLDKPLIKNVPYNGLTDARNSRYYFSTAGLNAASRHRMVYAYAYALAEDGEKNSMEGTGQMNRLTANINIPNLVETVADTSLDLLEGKPVPSKHYDVIFDRECQLQMFKVFSMVYSGKAAKDGINPWRAKLGETVADSRLTLRDMPLVQDGFGYTLFDDEGVATADLDFIVDGKLNSMMHNSVTANHFGVKTTGHAMRGPRSTLGLGMHQLVIDAGDASHETLTAGEYIEVTSMAGLHSGANAISGDFSLGVSGFLCKDGKRVQPVRGVTVAGNFYKMLNKIHSIGSESYWNWQRTGLMPSIRFAELAISGE